MPTVMVVDDTAIVRETVSKLLRREGFQTICAANGQEALNALQNSKADLVLLDITMPIMDGFVCLDTLRNDARFQALPVIMLTAMTDDEYQFRAHKLGATDYLIKTKFTLDDMLNRVRKHLPQN